MGTFLFLLSSCEKEIYEDHLKNEKRAEIKKISFEEFKKFSPALEKYQNLSSKKTQMDQGRIIYDSINDFYIDTDKIIYAQKDGISWFTFPISRDYAFEKTENLILRSNIDGKFVALILEYNFNSQDKELVKNNLPILNLTEKTQVKFLEELKIEDFDSGYNERFEQYANYYCVAITSSWCSGNQGHPGGFESDGGKCPCYSESTITVCVDNQQGGGEEPDEPNNPIGTSTSNNTNYGTNSTGSAVNYTTPDVNTTGGVYGNGGTNGLGIVTIPVLSAKTPAQIKLEFQTTLTPEQIAWLNNPLNNDLEYEIIKYLTDNQIVTDVEEVNPTFAFAQQTIAQIMLNPILFTSIKPFLIEKQIDDSELDDCTKVILDDLKNLQQQDIAKIFAKLNNPVMIVKPQYNTKIVIENPINSNTAFAQANYVTVPMSGPQPGNAGQSSFNYIIRIRPSYLNGTMLTSPTSPIKPTKLSIARTVLHELIHVYLNSLYDDCAYGISCTEIKSFEDLWQDYLIDQNGGTNPNDAQHLAFAKNFTNILARALQEYQTGVAVSDTVEPHQDYKDLAWLGLHGNEFNSSDPLTQIFNSEYPLGSEKRERFNKINDAENMQQSSNVNGSLITPISTPCN